MVVLQLDCITLKTEVGEELQTSSNYQNCFPIQSTKTASLLPNKDYISLGMTIPHPCYNREGLMHRVVVGVFLGV